MLYSLRIVDFSDRELLHILNDLANQDGWADSREIAEELGIEHRNPAQCVGQRLSWLAKHGCVEKHKDEKHMWSLTEFGEAIMHGKLSKAAEKQLEGMDAAQLLLATRLVTRAYQGLAADTNGGGSAAWLLRREWANGTHIG